MLLQKQFLTIGFALTFGFLASFETAAQTHPAYRTESNIAYCDIAGKNLTLNAFLPADADAPVPAIVEIHGGLWFGGGAASHIEEVGGWQFFKRHHLAVFSINYRLGMLSPIQRWVFDHRCPPSPGLAASLSPRRGCGAHMRNCGHSII